MKNRTLLLVEDNQDDAFLMQRALKKVGFACAVQVVRDGQAALDYLSGTGSFKDREMYPHPAMILLDLKLPYVSGIEVLEWVRNQSGIPYLPVIILTSSRERSDVDRAYVLGATSYLVKPASTEELVRMIASLNEYWFTHNQFHSAIT